MENIEITPEEAAMLLGDGRQEDKANAPEGAQPEELAEKRFSMAFKDLNCIARMLQSALTQQGNPYAACDECRYCCHREEFGKVRRSPYGGFVLWRLCHITGVRLIDSPEGCLGAWMREYDQSNNPDTGSKRFSGKEQEEGYFGIEEQRQKWQEKNGKVSGARILNIYSLEGR